MRTLKFKAQPTNAFFASVNQVFGGSSQFPITAERAAIKSLSTAQTTKKCSPIVGSWEEPPSIWLTAAKNAFVGWALNFKVRMLMKSAVNGNFCIFVSGVVGREGDNIAFAVIYTSAKWHVIAQNLISWKFAQTLFPPLSIWWIFSAKSFLSRFLKHSDIGQGV